MTDLVAFLETKLAEIKQSTAVNDRVRELLDDLLADAKELVNPTSPPPADAAPQQSPP